MSQINVSSNQEWLRVLGKGMVTIPKKWREALGIITGDIVRARKEGSRVIIEGQNDRVPYRTYSDAEIEEFLKEDKLPSALVKKLKKKFT